MTSETRVQQHWSYDVDDREIRDEYDGSVLFDVHNATDEQATIAAAAPDLLAALEEALALCEADNSPFARAMGEWERIIRRARGED